MNRVSIGASSIIHLDENKEDVLDENKEDVLDYELKFEKRQGEIVQIVKYTKKPLGLDVESGADGTNLYVTASNHDDAAKVKKGMLLVQINQYVVRELKAPEIVDKIKLCELPIQICFVYIDPKRILARGLSLRIRRSTAVSKGLVKIYLPNGTPYNVEAGKFDLKVVVDMVCKNQGLIPEEMVLLMQNREKENDVQHPSLDESAEKWEQTNAKHYRLRLISKEMAERYREGVPVDGISILTKRGFTDEHIQELRKFMNMVLHLPVDAAVAALSNTIEVEYYNMELTKDEIMAIVVWHKNIVKQEDIFIQSPKQHVIRVYFEGDGLQHKTYGVNNPMITAGELCEIVSVDQKIMLPKNYALHIKGLSDVRAFEQELSPEDIPNQVKQAIVQSGGYGRLQFVYKETEDESSSGSGSESTSSGDIALAPTAKAFRVGSIDGWTNKEIDQLRKAMEEYMNEMKLQEQEAAENETKLDEMDTETQEELEMQARRLELLKECVLKQYQLSEVIHDFDASSIKDFPSHKKLQNLTVGEVMIVTDTDVSGWSRGKNINGGDEAYFPASYVEVVAQPEMLVEVIHDFDPSKVSNLPGALTVIALTAGELILVTGTHVSGWWRGCKVKGGPEGYFPGDYTNLISSPAMDMSFRKIYGDCVLDGNVKLRVGALKRFQSKYCWLTQNELVYFNTEASDPQKPAGRIELRKPNVKSSVVHKNKNKGKFNIKVGNKSYECKVDVSEVQEWVKTLTDLFGQ